MDEKVDFANVYQDEVPSLEDALEYAIDAIERGDIHLGGAALEWVLQRQPENPVAWIWKACTAPDEKSRRECLFRADSMGGPSST